MAVTFGSAIPSPAKKQIRPLSFLEKLLLPLLLFAAHGEQKLELRRREQWTKEIAKRRVLRLKLQAEVDREAKIYRQLLVSTWTRLGERSTHLTDGSRAPRVKRVRIEFTAKKPEIISYKILVRQKTLFSTIDALPYRVKVSELINEETLKELSYAVGRVVSAKDDPRYGVWVQVHRLEGVGGIPSRVTFADMLDNYPDDLSLAPLIVGVGEHDRTHIIDLESAPHGLIAGSTKSGKSNLLNFILSCFIRFMTPDDLKLTLIDLKRMEFNHFKLAPHLARPVVFSPEDAIGVLSEAIQQIQSRAEIMSERNIKNLASWNEKYPGEKFCRNVIVIDEFAELMLASGASVARQVDYLVSRVSNLGRAVGIHLIICTQRPAKQVVPMSVKANMAFIVAGRTGDPYSSGVILGTAEAYRLPLWPGRMIVSVGSEKHEIQTPFISDDDISESVAIARGRVAGVIRLENAKPVLNIEGMLLWIVRENDGLIAPNLILQALRPLAVPARELRDFLTELRTKTDVEASDGRHYRVMKKGNQYFLELVRDIVDTSQPDDDVIEAEFVADQILMLPAPKFDPIEIFVREECNVAQDKKVKATPLYLKYQRWCNRRGFKPTSQKLFGIQLKKLGFDSKRGTGGAYWWTGLTHSELEELK